MVRYGSLVARLSRYMTLTDAERDSLDWMERREIRLAPAETLVREGSDSDMLFVVQSGWLHASVTPANAARQILRFHYAGDLMGASGIGWLPAVHTLTAVSDCVVSELSRANLARVFREQPRLASLFYAVAAVEGVVLCDRLTSIARLDARQRVATLLLDILARLRVSSPGVVRSFDLPLTQGDIGDATGLTKVHVNRMLARLEAEGFIRREGRRMAMLDEAGLIALTGFVDRYATLDTGWIADGPDKPGVTRMPPPDNLDHKSAIFMADRGT